jgi:hypothetical protein
VDVRKVTKK